MIRITLLPVLFFFTLVNQPSGTVTDGPRSIRSFRPVSSATDDALETYFNEAGPLAIEFYEHLTLLSNPWLAGRQPGTDGSHIASDYVVWNFQQSNLSPAFDDGTSWFQPFDFQLDRSTPTLLKEFVSVDDMALIPERDYVVLGNSGSGNVTGKITFVGYAIESGENGYSSFDKDTDLTGQVAMMLRYEPLDENGASQWAGRRFSPHASMRDKMQAVIDRGAIGVILVNPPNCRDGRRGLESMRSSRFGSTEIPVVQFTEHTANLAILGYDIAKLQQDADASKVTTKSLGSKATLSVEVETSVIHARNIGGVLQGRGDLEEEWIVIGGHYDHLGYGYLGTQREGELHAGADDNASGTSVVMILARLLSEQYADSEDDSLRSILFILFDAEEAGLHGSAQFVENPIMELDSINAMINLDMVGNLSEGNLLISGTGTA
ncbi:MAG TPA: M28 family peptidase, partial [Phycisphaerales bacterium]|nr:M28 family peptidase [Phycisphaerales bacterium]